jgi:hypothetical protein
MLFKSQEKLTMENDNTLRTLADLGMAAARQRERSQDEQPQQVEQPQVLMVAEIESHDGLSAWTHDTVETVTGPTGPIVRARSGQTWGRYPPGDYLPVQPATIRVLHHHDRDREVGVVEYLEWAEGPTRIYAVCAVDAAVAEEWEAGGDAFVSPGTLRDRSTEKITLDHLGLCRSTARIGAPPVKWAHTTLERAHSWTPQTTPGYRWLLRAADARRKRAQGAGLPIVGHPGLQEQPGELRHAASRGQDPPPYMRHNGEDGLFYSGGQGSKILRVR